MRLLRFRQFILLLGDIIVINASALLSLGLRFDFIIPKEYLDVYYLYSPLYIAMVIITFYLCGAYRSLWRYASIEEMYLIIKASIYSMVFTYGLFSLFHVGLPRSFYGINLAFIMLTMGGIRFSYRFARRFKGRYRLKSATTKVLVVGAGKAGFLVLRELVLNPDMGKIPVGLIDDDKTKLKRRIQGIPILGTRHDIKRIVKEKQIDEIILAIPSMNKKERMNLIELCAEAKCKLKTLPGMYEIIDGKVDIQQIRDVEIEDLLGRESIQLNTEEISHYIAEEVVLITGGGGSIGSELCRQIAKFNPKKLLILDIYENNAYEIQQELVRKYKDKLDLEVLIASIRDRKRMHGIFEQYKPGVVFHAAAHKHVPLMEHSPMEAVKNNVFGTLNTAELADAFGVKRFVLISTDKAVNPTNIMGATKRIAEMIIQTMDKHSSTEFVAVRFGNVLGSNGSVIPLFKKQIAEGGPITVTHPDIIRYFMTIPEAVQLVIQAGSMAKGGEIFVLDMGDPVKIIDLAKDLIRLSGFEPEIDIPIVFSGLRPGEKLYEELLLAEEGVAHTRHEKIFIAKPIEKSMRQLKQELQVLEHIIEEKVDEQNGLLDVFMRKLVPTYKDAAS